MTAREYLNNYSGKLLEVELTNGENWIGVIVSASGSLSWDRPEPVNVDFDRVLDIEEYRRLGFQYDYKHETISPKNIKKVTILE